jgi:methyl-accepting chemotaxis protein
MRREALASAESSYRVARATTWTLVLGVTLLGLVVSFLLARSLSRPVVRMAESMARAAKGDLSDTLEFDARGDELGDLSRSINGTYVYLQEMAASRRASPAATCARASRRARTATASARRSWP